MGGGGTSYISWEDFKVGKEVMIYGRNLSIVDCDTFTREFYGAKGKPQGPAISIPDDPYLTRRKGAHDRVLSKVCMHVYMCVYVYVHGHTYT